MAMKNNHAKNCFSTPKNLDVKFRSQGDSPLAGTSSYQPALSCPFVVCFIYRLVQAITPNLSSIQCPRRFLEIHPEIWHVLYEPSLPTRYRFCFSGLFCFCCWKIWVLGDPKLPAKKKKRKKPPFVNGLAGTHRTREQTIRIFLQKMAWTFRILCGKRV